MSLSEYNKFKKDLKNSKTHKFMHLPEEDKKEIFSAHRRDKHKTVWHRGGIWLEMESKNSPTNQEIVSYRCPTFPYHSLHKCVMTIKTPKIKVMDDFKICFCKNLFINMVRSFRLFHNEIELQYGNNLSLFEEVLNDPLWENYISFHSGNQEQLTTPSQELPSTYLSLTLPFYYSHNRSDAFPLIYCGQKDDLIHQVEFNLEFSSLLTIFDREGNKIKFNKDLIEVENNSEMMPIPELEGLFSFLEEEDARIINSFNKDDVGDDKELYTKSIYYYEDENPKNLDNKVVLKFANDDKQPVQDIFWGAKNNTQTEEENNLVLTFDNNSPTKYTEKLSSSSGVLLANKSSYKTEFAYHKGKGVLGLNRWSNSNNEKEDGKKFVPGVKCNGGSLIVKLQERTSEDKFVVFSVLKYLKRFRFISYPKSFQERKDMRSTVVPDDED